MTIKLIDQSAQGPDIQSRPDRLKVWHVYRNSIRVYHYGNGSGKRKRPNLSVEEGCQGARLQGISVINLLGTFVTDDRYTGRYSRYSRYNCITGDKR